MKGYFKKQEAGKRKIIINHGNTRLPALRVNQLVESLTAGRETARIFTDIIIASVWYLCFFPACSRQACNLW
ncbi:MAG: hypothetical protein ABIK27_02285 [Bacteroidota bacterium]